MDKKEITKKKIGEAAMQCFNRFGLDKTTLDDIAKAVGLNKASLYYYYKNKESIFLEVAVSEGEEYLKVLQEQTVKKKGLEKQVVYYMQSRFEYYQNVLNMSRVSTETLNKILPGFFELYESMMKAEKVFLGSIIKKASAAGEIGKVNEKDVASVLINISDALKHSVEQKAILMGSANVDYTQALSDMKYIITYLVKGLRK